MALQTSDSDLERGDPAPDFELPATVAEETYSSQDCSINWCEGEPTRGQPFARSPATNARRAR